MPSRGRGGRAGLGARAEATSARGLLRLWLRSGRALRLRGGTGLRPTTARTRRRPPRVDVTSVRLLRVPVVQAPDPDVIATRPGEELDAAAVGRYLEGKIPGRDGHAGDLAVPGRPREPHLPDPLPAADLRAATPAARRPRGRLARHGTRVPRPVDALARVSRWRRAPTSTARTRASSARRSS